MRSQPPAGRTPPPAPPWLSGPVLALHRVRGPLYYAAAFVLIGHALFGSRLSGSTADVAHVAVLVALAVAALCLVATVLGPRLLPEHAVREVPPPVRGRWLALNSPATKVPSHGVRAYGQAYAIDLCHEPRDRERPTFGGPAFRDAAAYPAFGQPVHAMVDGVVVRASGWRRDHRARSNMLGVALMTVEGIVREIGGPGWILGNQVTIRGDDGAFATVAHLQRGSLRVRRGDRVAAGDVIAQCGNSGNTSEPHVHAQLMDRASVWTGQGLPLAFTGVTLGEGGEPTTGVPANQEHLDTVEG